MRKNQFNFTPNEKEQHMGNSSSSTIRSLPEGINTGKSLVEHFPDLPEDHTTDPNEVITNATTTPSYHDLKKFVALGAAKTGKSCMICQHWYGVFIEKYTPTEGESYRKQSQVDGTPVCYEILDVGGGDNIPPAIIDKYIQTSQGFIIVYSVCDQASFDKCPEIHERVLRAKDDSVPMVLVGTMSDREDRVVPTLHGEELAKQLGIPFFETSAKNRINIDEVFEEIVRQIIRSENLILSYDEGKN